MIFFFLPPVRSPSGNHDHETRRHPDRRIAKHRPYVWSHIQSIWVLSIQVHGLKNYQSQEVAFVIWFLGGQRRKSGGCQPKHGLGESPSGKDKFGITEFHFSIS